MTRKLALTGLSVLMAVSLFGCKPNKENKTTDTSKPSSTETSEETATPTSSSLTDNSAKTAESSDEVSKVQITKTYSKEELTRMADEVDNALPERNDTNEFPIKDVDRGYHIYKDGRGTFNITERPQYVTFQGFLDDLNNLVDEGRSVDYSRAYFPNFTFDTNYKLSNKDVPMNQGTTERPPLVLREDDPNWYFHTGEGAYRSVDFCVVGSLDDIGEDGILKTKPLIEAYFVDPDMTKRVNAWEKLPAGRYTVYVLYSYQAKNMTMFWETYIKQEVIVVK